MDIETSPEIGRRELLRLGLELALAASAFGAIGCGSGESSSRDSVSAPSGAKDAPLPGASAPPAPAPPAAAPSAPPVDTETQLVSELESAAATVGALQYVNQSAKSDQRCGNCQLYTAKTGGRGKCALFLQGQVKETGWCASWVAKVD